MLIVKLTIFWDFFPQYNRNTLTKYLWTHKVSGLWNRIQPKEAQCFIGIFENTQFKNNSNYICFIFFFLHTDYVDIYIKINNVNFMFTRYACEVFGSETDFYFGHSNTNIQLHISVLVPHAQQPHRAMQWELDGKDALYEMQVHFVDEGWRNTDFLCIYSKDNFLCFPSERIFLKIGWKDPHNNRMNNGLSKIYPWPKPET